MHAFIHFCHPLSLHGCMHACIHSHLSIHIIPYFHPSLQFPLPPRHPFVPSSLPPSLPSFFPSFHPSIHPSILPSIRKTFVFYSSYKVSLLLIIFSFSVPYDTAGRIKLICPSYSAGNKPNHNVHQYRYKEITESAGHSSDPGLATSAWESWFPYFPLTCHFIIEKLEWTMLLVNRTTFFVNVACLTSLTNINVSI